MTITAHATDTSQTGTLFYRELLFTRTFRTYRNAHVAVREIKCLESLYPHIFLEIQEGDLIAGRTELTRFPKVGFALEQDSGGFFYYCDENPIRKEIARPDIDDDYRSSLVEMLTFWKTETTARYIDDALPEEIKVATTNDIAEMGFRMAGPLLDFDKLLRLGIPGLREEIDTCAAHGSDHDYYDAMRAALDLLVVVARHYAAQARARAETATEQRKRELLEIGRICEHVAQHPPSTLHEAMQLFWLYVLVSTVENYGRMDIYLGDFYCRDIDNDTLTEQQALLLLQNLWKIIAERNQHFNSRIILGGYGRRNPPNADRFALAALEATRTVKETEPQLSLRCHRGMDRIVWQKALDVISEGRTYPVLYNDDVNVPAVARAFSVSTDQAQRYLPYGCGEYALDHLSVGSPNCGLNLLKALETVLHDGHDGISGEPLGIPTGASSSFTTFGKLWDAYTHQVEHHLNALARRHAIEYDVERKTAGFVYVSMLYDHCIEQGRSVADHGTGYQGGIVESYGLVNTADSLTAIKLLVYDTNQITLQRLIEALDADFKGYERELKLMRDAPKFGNDNRAADAMARQVSDHAARAVKRFGTSAGLDYYLMVNINNHMNVGYGRKTAASAEGRRSGSPLANGMTPTAGNDAAGITALLNSLVTIDPSIHAGYTHNLKFGRATVTHSRDKLELLLTTYFSKGGTQAMITVVDKGELEQAMREPGAHRNLMVRVGGFSARFVELAPDIQKDILNRTLY